jgi:hypothetical protein
MATCRQGAAIVSQDAQGAESSLYTAALAAKVSELENKVEYLSERQRIIDVYRRYTRGLNRYDMELLHGTFWPDAQINYGFDSHLRDDWIGRWKDNRYLKGLSCQAHHITNETVDIDREVAHVESYLIALWTPPKDDKPALILGGRYIDRLDRRNGEWRIAVREFIPHFWSEATSIFSSVWPHFSARMAAGDGTTDLCYRRPLNPRPDKRNADGG